MRARTRTSKPDPKAASSAAYAVMFRTHFWDAFAARQLERLRPFLGRGKLFILADETRGKLHGPPDVPVFGVTDQQILDAGFVRAGEGSIQWFSGDTPLYLFRRAHPEFAYYVQLEYDVSVSVNLDEVIASLEAQGRGLATRHDPEPLETWHWRASCKGVYSDAELRHELVCFSVFSGETLDRLMAARLKQAERFRAGAIAAWPHCEAFVATEAALAGIRSADLAELGDVSGYQWWPPYLEGREPELAGGGFIHPVLDRKRYVSSLLKNNLKLSDVLAPSSWLHAKMRRLGANGYVAALTGREFRAAAGRTFRKRFGVSDGG